MIVHVTCKYVYVHAEEKEEYDPSGRKTYIKTCKTLGIIPTSYFMRTIQNGESQLNMGHHGVGPKGAKAIAISLTVSCSDDYGTHCYTETLYLVQH